MKYLLFINFNSGLMHNKVYTTLNNLHESVVQCMADEKLDAETEELPSIKDLRKCLCKNDDYFQQLSNGTWYHIQQDPVFS